MWADSTENAPRSVGRGVRASNGGFFSEGQVRAGLQPGTGEGTRTFMAEGRAISNGVSEPPQASKTKLWSGLAVYAFERYALDASYDRHDVGTRERRKREKKS